MPAIMVNAPFEIPDTPKPAMARPMISIFDEVATPQINDPTSKTKKKPIYVHCDCYYCMIGDGLLVHTFALKFS
jgi:anaerobic selenocysteine-containing dehydrogenase